MTFEIKSEPFLDGFSGLVRLFPLPNFVMFPGVIKGLHIFEPRYCSLLRESLSTDKLIAMALLTPGWETQYLDRPAIHDVVCVGKVAHHTPTADGRHNILLYGLRRARILQEALTKSGSFRRAQIDLLDDQSISDESEANSKTIECLLNAFRRTYQSAHFFSVFPVETVRGMPLGLLTDLLSHEVPMTIEEKQALLSETSVPRRVQCLLKFLGDGGSNDRKSPPNPENMPPRSGDSYSSGFSAN